MIKENSMRVNSEKKNGKENYQKDYQTSLGKMI